MSDEQTGDKTELPTDRRREQMREEGNVVRSTDLTIAVAILATTAGFTWLGPGFIEQLASLLRESLAAPKLTSPDLIAVCQMLVKLILAGLVALSGWMLLLVATSIAINLAQVGFLFAWDPIVPKWSRINPISGLGRIFSSQGAVKLAGSLLKLIVLSLIAYGAVGTHLETALGETDQGIGRIATRAGSAMIGLAVSFSIALIVLAALDYLYQYWKFEQDLMMTKQEVRDEYKQMEGDPQIRQQRKEAHRKLVQSKQMNAVKTADGVITNPTHYSVAIKYDEKTMSAPIVVAKGQDEIALRIRELAREHNVPLIENKPLARALYRDVKVGRPVPIELYGAVAEILAYVYRLKGKDKRPKRPAA